MNQLALSFFGAFEALLGDKPLINFRSAKAQGLLIYLALTQQQVHDRDVLTALFWPDEPEKTAKHNLRQTLYRLRLLLEDTDGEKQQYLLITRATVQFNPTSDYCLDVAGFLAALEDGELETAVSLYNGELLPGFSCDSLPFDDWLRQEREHHHRLALGTLYQLTTRSLSQADFQKARRFAQKQLALEPWREEAHRQLMQALAALGERSAALAQYETCRAVLAEELGADPATETTNLAKRIREDQIQRPILQQSADTSGRQRLKIPFVGRKAEYETLVNAYRRTSRDGLQLVMILGQAGMGKTRLTEQFLTWAAIQGADVLIGRSFETSAGLSYQPLTHLLRQRIERENAPEDLLSDLWLSQLTRLLPELRDRYPDLPPPTQEENTARQHLFEAITRLGQALAARRPVVLFIDDWHWADTASLDVLHYAAQRWAEEKVPILLLLTLRQEALTDSPDLQSWLNQLKRTVSAVQLNIDALSLAETEQLMQELLTPEVESATVAAPSSLTQFSHWLFTQTNGQPLFLTEALKVLAEDEILHPDPKITPAVGSGQAVWLLDWSLFDAQRAESRILAGVREIVQGWLTRISAPATAMLTATAVLAQEASFDNLCRVTGLDELQAVTALDELLKRQLLLETAETQSWARDPLFTFSHQKISEAVYTEAGTARRRLLHRRAFEALQATAVPAAELARHALSAGLLAETIHYSLLAGNEAIDLFAVRVAITHYETVWQVAEQNGWLEGVSGADRRALYTGLGRAYELSESWAKAEETYKAMIAYAQSIGATAMECQGLNSLAAVYYLMPNKVEQAVALLQRALTIAEQSGNRRGMAETVWNLAMAAHQVGELDLALHHAEQALNLTRDLKHPQFMARHLSILAYIYIRQRQWDKVEAYAAEASRLYIDSGKLVLADDSQRVLGFGQILAGKPQEALATLQKAAAFGHQIENLWGEAECAWKLAYTWLELGDYGKAVRLARKGVQLADKLDLQPMNTLALSVWGTVQRTIMALDGARKTFLEELINSTEQQLIEVVLDWDLTELCAVHALAGDWRQAHEYARQRLQVREDESLLPMGLSGWYETEALLRGGDGALARTEVERLGRIVGNNRRYRLILLRSQAVLAQWDGAVDQAITHLEAAFALAQEIGLPGEEWPILSVLGELYAERDAEAMAQQAYKDATVIIHRLAETIDEEDLRVGYLTAVSVQSILKQSERV